MQREVSTWGLICIATLIAESLLLSNLSAQEFPFKLAFDTNKDIFSVPIYDSTDIYTVDVDGRNLANLTKDGNSLNPVWSSDGTKLAYININTSGERADIFIMDSENGSKLNLTASINYDDSSGRAYHLSPAWSPDNRKIAYSVGLSSSINLYVVDANGNHLRRLTASGENRLPRWSPDGKQIAFYSWKYGFAQALHVIEITEGSVEKFLNITAFYFQWSLDSSTLLLSTNFSPNDDYEIFIINLDGSGLLQLTSNVTDDISPAWSPDGTNIAFLSRTGRIAHDIFLMSADGTNQRNLTNNPIYIYEGPFWSPNGTKLAFIGNPNSTRDTDRIDPLYDIYVLDIQDGNPVNITNTPSMPKANLVWYFDKIQANLEISSLTITPDPPIAFEDATISFIVKNNGNAIWTAKSLVAEINIIDWKNQGPGDSAWLLVTNNEGQIRQDERVKFIISRDLEAGESEIVSIPFKFSTPDYADELEVILRPGVEGDVVDEDDFDEKTKKTDLHVEFNPQNYINCFGEILTGLTHGIVNDTHACYATVALKGYYEAGSLTKDAFGVFGLIKEGESDPNRFIEAGRKSAEILLKSGTQISEELLKDPSSACGTAPVSALGKTSVFYSYIKAAWNEFTGRGCGASLVHSALAIKNMNRGMMEKMNATSWLSKTNALMVASPVDLEVINEAGKNVYVGMEGNVDESMEDAVGFIAGTLKVVLVPAEGSYSVKVIGRETGTADITIVKGMNDNNSAIISYDDVPVTSNSVSSIPIAKESLSEGVMTYTLNTDNDGDGIIDSKREPDRVEVVEAITAVAESIDSRLPKSVELFQNYPNPFNTETTIRFNLVSEGKVELSIYDISGRRIRILSSRYYDAGYHTVVWDGKDKEGHEVATGIYIYALDIKGVKKEKKLVVLR